MMGRSSRRTARIVAGMMRLKFWSPGPNRFPHRVITVGTP